MRRFGILLASLTGFIALNAAHAITADNRYLTIVERNAFGLNPPPTNAPEVVVEPPVTIKFTGITSFGNQKRAWFALPAKDPKQSQSQYQYINLPEGQRDGILEVVAIYEEQGEVRIRNSGAEQILSLKNNGLQPVAVVPPTGVPGAPPQPPGNNTAGVVANSANNVVAGNYGRPPTATPGIPQANPEPTQAGATLNTVPTRQVRMNSVVAQSATPPVSSVKADAAAQLLKMQVDAGVANKQGRPFPPPPPVPGH